MTFFVREAVTTLVGPPPEPPPQQMGELTVDATPGGVGFDLEMLQRDGFWAQAACCHLEGGAIRYREDGGAACATAGITRRPGNVFWVRGAAALQQFRAAPQTEEAAKISFTLYF